MVEATTSSRHSTNRRLGSLRRPAKRETLKNWEQKGLGVDSLRMDNAKENKKIKNRMQSAEWQLATEVEFNARATPQQNSPVETGFDSIANRARAMLNAAKVPQKWQCKLLPYAALCATDVDGLIVVEWNGKTATRAEHWCGELPKFAGRLRTWGEAGVVTVKTKRTTRVDDRGKTCMMVGYAKGRDGNVYRMWHMGSGTVYESRYVVWLKRMYFTEAVEEDEKTRRELKDVRNATDTEDVEFEAEEGIGDTKAAGTADGKGEGALVG